MSAPVRMVGLVVALIGAGASCGDGDDLPRALPDASASIVDAGTLDAAAPTPRGVQVENAGAACTREGDCRGADAMCLTSLGLPPLGVSLPAGYCTASCTSSADCGSGGGCPLGDLLAGPPLSNLLAESPLGDVVKNVIPFASMCLDRCTPLGRDACRPGYECRSTRELIPEALSGELGVLLFLPALWATYCIPPVELPTLPDGGVRPDASTTTPDAGTSTDAGIPSDAAVDTSTDDASTDDASTDDAATDAGA